MDKGIVEQLKPIFHQGKLIAWTGSIMHTPETGGIAPGGMSPIATEIIQEGTRFQGLKVVEKGKRIILSLRGIVASPPVVPPALT